MARLQVVIAVVQKEKRIFVVLTHIMNCRKLLLFFVFLAFLHPLRAQEDDRGCAKRHIGQTSRHRQMVASSAHARRMRKYDVRFHHLDIALERTSTAISGNVLTNAVVLSPLDTFSFELHQNLLIDSVRLNGLLLPVQRSLGEGNVKLPAAAAAGSSLSVRIYYHGTPPAGSGFMGAGMSNGFSQTWGNQVTWSLSQPFSAYEWWPCKQDLTDKADSVHVFVTTSNANKVGSNGLLTAEVNLPNSKKRYEWKSRYPIAYYLFRWP